MKTISPAFARDEKARKDKQTESSARHSATIMQAARDKRLRKQEKRRESR